MGARAVQVSFDTEILRRIDKAPETKKLGRSGFIRQAVEVYFRAQRERELDENLRRAYGAPGVREALLKEVEEFLPLQAWPADSEWQDD